MTAAMNDVDEETLKNLHAMCVTEVRKINGIIDYENAVEYQRERLSAENYCHESLLKKQLEEKSEKLCEIHCNS